MLRIKRFGIGVGRSGSAAARTKGEPIGHLKVRGKENTILVFDEKAVDFFGRVAAHLRGRAIRKTIYLPGKLLNIVVG